MWIINHYASPPDRASATRHFDLGQSLVRRGHQVTIFAAGFSHATRREERLTRGSLWRTQNFDGVVFVWVRTTPYSRNDWRRIVNMATFFVMTLIVQFRFRRPDVVMGSTVHPLAALAGELICRVRRSRFVFEIRDLWPESLIALGATRRDSVTVRSMRWLEHYLIRRARAVVTVLDRLEEYLASRMLPARRIAYVPNGVSIEQWDANAQRALPDAIRSTIERARAEGRVLVGYVGAHGTVNRLDVILEAAAEIERAEPARVQFLFVGDGVAKQSLRTRASQLQLPVDFHDPVPKRLVPALLAQVDIGVVHVAATAIHRYGMSFNKVFDYMAAQLPVAMAASTRPNVVDRAEAGITVSAEDPERLATALLELASDAGLRTRLGSNGRRYVEREHRIDLLAARLEEALSA